MFQAEPIRVVVTGAAGQIAYNLLYIIAKGDVFGPKQPLILHLLDIPNTLRALFGVVMELDDCAWPLLHDVVPTANPEEAFENVSAAFLVGAMTRKKGMEKKDLLAINVKIFKAQGEALNKYARKDVKVLVVGNPANTNCLVCAKYAPSIPYENFTAMTRQDQNRAQSQIAFRARVPVDRVFNVIIWGNHSSSQVPDASHAKISTGCLDVTAADVLQDDIWLHRDFVEIVQKRGAAVIAARKKSSALSAAKAAADHMCDWIWGTEPGRFVSMGVLSDGSYGAPKDVVFSFPVTITDGRWEIVQGLEIDGHYRKLLDRTGKELEEEKSQAFTVVEVD